MKRVEEELSETLYRAYRDKEPIVWQEVERDALNQQKAYEIQHAFNQAKDERIRGYKISLTSQATQDLFHADSPLYGQIVASSVLKDGARIDRSELNEPLLELELEFTVLEDLLPEDDQQALLEKTELAPGVEIPDSRFKDWFPSLPLELVISDSAVCGRVVVGPPAAKLEAGQLANIHARATRDGEAVAEGVSSEVLGNPLHALHWLVQKLAQEGKVLGEGTTISSGTFCLPKKLMRGHYEAVFDQGLGSVSFDVD
ncbi:MAG: 2-keto-4-pentenoate hydratase [Sporolactobacillus sp.]